MTDREKTIAEIREKYLRTCGNVTGQMVLTHEQVSFLLSELDRLQGALAGAAHIANLTQMELRELREDRQKLIEAIERIRERAEAAEADDEWGWLQALRSIRRTIREVNVDET